MVFPTLPTRRSVTALLVAFAWGCGGAAPAAQPEAPVSSPGYPSPGDTPVTTQSTKSPDTDGTDGDVPATSQPQDEDVPGGGSSATPSGEAETDEGEEVVLGATPTFGSQGSAAVSSLSADERERLHQAVQQAARAHRAELKQCRDARAGAHPKLQGVVTVAFVVGTDGRISQAEITQSDTGDDELDRCVLQDVEQWQITPPPRRPLPVAVPLVIARSKD